ncbi:MAG: hypothetical protein ABJH04_14665 [Cyclobacteriaceae bacterium]
MKKITILSITLLFFITSCSTEKHTDEHTQSEETPASHSAPDLIQLDNGNKWAANIETTEGIDNMTQMIEAAQSDPVSSVASLKENLLMEFTDILNKCTMKGESHEQLHNYLLPLKADIEKLSETYTPEELENIQSYLAKYDTYFK